MVGKKFKWAAHLKAAESSGLSLMAYATKHEFDVRRLYDARHLRKLQATTAWSVVRVKEPSAVEVAPKVQQRATPSTVAMQAHLGNGVVLSWAQDQTHTAALDGMLRTLAALPCSI
ncbi:MAG: hypothetical protein Q7T69_04005 [Rhodoferax sp.]|nr:hypothetical protein [Rhodoferax sp.]